MEVESYEFLGKYVHGFGKQKGIKDLYLAKFCKLFYAVLLKCFHCISLATYPFFSTKKAKRVVKNLLLLESGGLKL